MPLEAFIDEVELRSLVPEGARGRLAIISISHCWRTSKNPDPDGATLRSVGALLRERERMRGGTTRYAYWPREAGVFLDWCSLLQKDPITDERTEEEAQLFDKALRNMTLWYAHQKCTSFLMVNSGDELRPYDARGWTTFEASVSRFLKLSLPFLWPAIVVSGEDETEAARHGTCVRSQEPPIPLS